MQPPLLLLQSLWLLLAVIIIVMITFQMQNPKRLPLSPLLPEAAEAPVA